MGYLVGLIVADLIREPTCFRVLLARGSNTTYCLCLTGDDGYVIAYKDKKGDQRKFGNSNPLQLVGGTNYFKKKTKFFDAVVGFTKFSEYLIVAEVRV